MGLDHVAIAVCYHEKTVGNLDRGSRTAKDVHPEAILPELPDLHLTQLGRLAKGMEHLRADE